MDLGQLLDETHEEIVAEAAEALACAQLTHYDESTGDQNRERLASLCDLARRCAPSIGREPGAAWLTNH